MPLSLPSAGDVRVVISTPLTDEQIDSIISDAALISEQCIESLDTDRQIAIIKWLTAHMISAIRNMGGGAITSDRLGDAGRSYDAANLGKDLRSTSYGQQALALDPYGCLARMGRPRATFEGM